LFIDGDEVVSNDGLHGPNEEAGNIYLTTGLHDITVLFYENTGGQVLEVSYSGPSLTKRLIPFNKLYSDCTPNSSVDLDGDGIEDGADLDTDGDGIPDSVECDVMEENYIESVVAFTDFNNIGNVIGSPGTSYAQSTWSWGGSSTMVLDFGKMVPVGTSVSVYLSSGSTWFSAPFQVQRSDAFGNNNGTLADTTVSGTNSQEVTFTVTGSPIQYIRIVTNNNARV